MERSNPVRMLCTYRIKNGKEAEFLSLLEKHWPTLRSVDLATDDAAKVLRARDKSGRTVFIELFSWNNPEAPGIAHQTPEIMSVWEPMGALTDEMNFWPIEDVAINFVQV